MKRLDKETFISKVKNRFSNEPFSIIEFNGLSKPGKYYCGLCQKEYQLSKMSKLISEKRKHLCSHCWASSYTKEVLNMFPNEELDFIKFGYNGNLHKPTIVYRCKKCSQINEKPLTEFIKYPTCIYCPKNAKRRNTIGLIQNLPSDFMPLEEYRGKDEKILFRHSCGFIFRTRPANIINSDTGCPKCNKKVSKGERKIIDFLEANKIVFEKEKKFIWSKNKRYDFFLPDFNLIIEYNGSQHYIDKGFFEKTAEEQQKIDIEKEAMAISHNLNYLIIPYISFQDIENILAQRLSLTGVGVVPPEVESTQTDNAVGEDIV